MESVGITIKPHAEIKPEAQRLCQWLRERGLFVCFDEATGRVLEEKVGVYPKSKLPSQVDLLVVMGGDGTLLSVARLPVAHSVPILGVNFGGLGFLTEISLDDLYPTLEGVLAGCYQVDERLMLKTQVLRQQAAAGAADQAVDRGHAESKIGKSPGAAPPGWKVVATFCNLNDVTVNKGGLARIIRLDTWINGQYVTTFLADGLIVSSPTGSTAYSLSAGGPIVHPATQAIILTAICPHTLTNRPLVLPDSCVIEVALGAKEESGFLTCDGQEGLELRPQDRVVISKSKYTLKLIQPSRRDYFQVLRTKLNWGVR